MNTKVISATVLTAVAVLALTAAAGVRAADHRRTGFAQRHRHD